MLSTKRHTVSIFKFQMNIFLATEIKNRLKWKKILILMVNQLKMKMSTLHLNQDLQIHKKLCSKHFWVIVLMIMIKEKLARKKMKMMRWVDKFLILMIFNNKMKRLRIKKTKKTTKMITTWLRLRSSTMNTKETRQTSISIKKQTNRLFLFLKNKQIQLRKTKQWKQVMKNQKQQQELKLKWKQKTNQMMKRQSLYILGLSCIVKGCSHTVVHLSRRHQSNFIG